MSNTFTQLYVHVVFSVKNRLNSISANSKERIHKYITGFLQNKGNKVLAINSMPDHIHVFFSLNPDMSISAIVRDMKTASTKFINVNKLAKLKFQWQEGFGAFSYSNSQIDNVIKNIMNQEIHHKKKSFEEEYLEILKKYNIEYNLKYVFDEDEL